MKKPILNITRGFSFRGRVWIIAAGLLIGVGSLVSTNRMAHMLRIKEKNEVSLWAHAMGRFGEFDQRDPLVALIISNNNNIPFIITDANLRVESYHLIPDRVINHPDLCRRKIEQLSALNRPMEIPRWDGQTYYLFYGSSRLLNLLLYFPLGQLMVIAVFVIFGYITFRSTKHDEQNRVWIGLAKETAHQLGTPTSSLLGWIEYLRSQPVDRKAVDEMASDLRRLMKVVDRFSKIGSETILSPMNVNELVGNTVLYFRSRIPRNVTLSYNGLAKAPMKADVNEALFEWVVENLLKNALDALQGRGGVDVRISDDTEHIYIDVTDTGKGIAKANFKRVFEPGFTTKTRGWGLGLSLSRRIVEDYHQGKIGVLNSEPGKGTTMRITLAKLYD
ncbi:MAG: HAMP domain-containing histidine kinase [Rikenellaceae bacterium]|jgi:hypothetical protein|nr:HAMP domain-containing histidine kinase [Rikenellaceae bacterium]